MEMEFVLVVKRSDFVAELALPEGYAELDAARALRLHDLIETRGFFVERRHAEQDPDLKQPIPYCIVHDERSLLCVRRKKRSSEGRLHGAWSVGIGGHIEPMDRMPTRQGEREAHNGPSSTRLHRIVERAARREIHEELLLSPPSGAQLVGWLNDDSNSVGAVHLGLVHLLRVGDAAEVAIRETDRLEGGFVAGKELLALRERHELLAQRANETSSNARAALRAAAPTATAPLGECRSLPDSPHRTASNDEHVPRDWSSLESWSRLVLEALRPRDLAALSV
jgi:predicted NUDIX family phosphoesterase